MAKCLPLYPSDEGKGIIRIDGLGRNNSGIAIGDTISVRKIKAVAAEKVVVAPLEAIPPIDERYLRGIQRKAFCHSSSFTFNFNYISC